MVLKKRNTRWETMDKSKLDLLVIKKHFEIHNRTEGKSARTVGWYNEVLGLLYRWLQEQSIPTILDSIDEMVIREFIMDLQSRPGIKGKAMSSHSIYNRVNALRSFFRWVHDQGYTTKYVLQDLKQPKTSELIVEPLSHEELENIFSRINSKAALGARNKAIVSLMLDAGLRLSEVAALQSDDAHIEAQYVKVMGKGSKERLVSFGASCQKALLHYYHHFRVEAAQSGVETFFLTIDGYPMTQYAIKSVIKRLANSSGVRRLHPHLLRHTYATMFLLNGGDVFLLKHNMGHTTLAMVQNYLHIAAQTDAIRSQGFSPLDRLNVKNNRKFSHGYHHESMNGHIYPNSGRVRGKKPT